MTDFLKDVRREVVELHEFFVSWFNGSIDREELEPRFLSHLSADVEFISPDGVALGREQLKAGFEAAYGANLDFKIEIRDVKILKQFGEIMLVTYTEWQKGARASAQPQNARITTALIEMGSRLTWHHIHETWLPESVRQADPFAF